MISSTEEWKALTALAAGMKKTHLKTLLEDKARNESLIKRIGSDVTLELSREKIDQHVINGFFMLFDKINLNDDLILAS